MTHSYFSTRGMVIAPHHLAASSGLRILENGGSAIEAMVAAAATISVVYPHMNSIGGDGFWLIKHKGQPPVAVHACGPAGRGVDLDAYRSQGSTIQSRGGQAALTVAGTIHGWKTALQLGYSSEVHGVGSHRRHRKRRASLPLRDLLADAIYLSRHGVPVTENYHALLTEKLDELKTVPGFAETFLDDEGLVPVSGSIQRQPRLAAVFEQCAHEGLDTFYRGDLAHSIVNDLKRVGSPLQMDDFTAYQAELDEPLSILTSRGTFWNTGAPTQGPFSLAILGAFDLQYSSAMKQDSFEHVHTILEATKLAFAARDGILSDPTVMKRSDRDFIDPSYIKEMVTRITSHAQDHSGVTDFGDTVYLTAADQYGTVVSFIQSLYWEFGSGVVLPETGILWQNRGVSFSLNGDSPNRLMPGIKPRHTLNPAMMQSENGDVMAYGTMGGDGQPQTQAAIATRVHWFGSNPQAAISSPRWLYGRTWGQDSSTVKIEDGFDETVIKDLMGVGHQIERIPRFSSVFGHAAALRVTQNGVLEGAYDPRSDGTIATW